MNDYINRVSKISEQGYTLHPDPKTHNEYMKTFLNKEIGKMAVAYRGTQTWIGQEAPIFFACTSRSRSFLIVRTREAQSPALLLSEKSHVVVPADSVSPLGLRSF